MAANSALSPILRRVLWLVGAAVLVEILFYSAITPLLPGYVDDLGLSKTQAGVLTGAYALGSLAASLPAGWLAVRWGARRGLVTGLTLIAIGCLAFGFGETFVVLSLSRLVQGVGGALSWAAGMAWLVEVAPRERRGQLLGTALGTAIGGAMAGPALGAAARLTSPELVFASAGVVAAILVAL